jgi:hypothetical protein
MSGLIGLEGSMGYIDWLGLVKTSNHKPQKIR